MLTIANNLSVNYAAAILEAASVNVKSVSKLLAAANKQYTNISQVLKDMQRTASDYRPVLEGLGAPAKVTPAYIRKEAEKVGLVAQDKKGNWQIARVIKRRVLDEDGTPKKDAAGNEIVKYEMGIIKSWSPSKVVAILAQAKAVEQVNAKKASVKK